MFFSVTILIGFLLSLTFAQDTGPCDFKTITQPIDHFEATNGSFQQRYSYFDNFYKPGGPIMFFQGEEGVGDCANTTIMYYFAEKLGGLAVSLEHRYFGQSLPFGTNASYTNPNLKYLTLDNVMADAVNFINTVKKTTPGASDSKAIVASGSYGGFLATAFRQNHPDTFLGSIAAAGPVMAFGNSTSPDTFYWWDYVSKIYMEESQEAAKKIRQGFGEVLRRTMANDTTLKDDLGLCEAPIATEAVTLIETLALSFMLNAEFNYARDRPGRGPGLAYPLPQTINITLAAETPLAAINDTNWLFYSSYGTDAPKCIDLSADFSNKYAAPGIEVLPFHYITCTYVPLKSSNFANGTLFALQVNSSDYFDTMCQQTYNSTPMSQEQIWTQYHLSPEELQNSTGIIFSVAQYDPTTSVAPAYIPPSADVCSSKYLYVSGMAHREDLFYPDPTDKDTVIKARDIELQTIMEWLDYCN